MICDDFFQAYPDVDIIIPPVKFFIGIFSTVIVELLQGERIFIQ